MKTRSFLYALIIVSLMQVSADADEPWLSEPWASADNLTGLDSDLQDDLSGAIWNPVTRTLWVCRNKGPSIIWSMVEDGLGGFEIYSQGSDTGKWDNGGTGFGDAEGITQADYSESNTVFIVVEEGEIREYDLSSYTTNVLTNTWNISAYIPAYFEGFGPEGITFVPDASLQASGFVDTNSVAYTSTNGMGGLMFVAHQRGGRIYVFDLNRTNATLGFVGAYKTGFEESSGLEFDRSNDVLYVSHGIGSGNNTNKLQALSLGSYEDAYEEMVFTNLTVYEMPGAADANIEGLAMTPRTADSPEHWIFLTQDGGGSDSLMWFREITTNSRSTYIRINAGTDDAEERQNRTMYLNSTDLELIYDSSNQTIGVRFNDVPIPDGATITNAFIQFTCRDTGGESAVTLTIKGQAVDHALTFSNTVADASSRTNTSAFVEWTPPGWSADAATSNERTPDLSTVVQEIVDRPGWSNGNSLAFIITGTANGLRRAWAYEGSTVKAAVLHCEWIIDTNVYPVIQFALAESNGPETNDTASIEITLSEASFTNATVNYSVTGGTASNGVDYTLASGTATITAGNTSTDIAITDITDSWTTPEFPETIIVTLFGPNKATLGTTNTHTYTINDYPRLWFQTPSMLDRFELVFDTEWNGTIEASGWCLGPATNEMLVVEGESPIRIHNFTGGEYTNQVRTIGLSNFGTLNDVEGICQVDPQNNLYALASERPGEITLAVITTNTAALDGDTLRTYSVVDGPVNKELEGVAYDPINNCFYTVKEKDLMAVYKVSGVPGSESVTELFDISQISGDVADLSDMFYDPFSAHLFLLSHESTNILECDLSGNVITSMSLSGDGAYQPEALTFSANLTNMYVGSEVGSGFSGYSDYYRYALSAPTTNCEENSTLELPVVLSWGWSDPVTVNYTITGTGSNPATAGADVTPASGVLTFSADDTAETISLTIVADGGTEDDETFEVRLSGPTNCSLIRDVVYHCTIPANVGSSTNTLVVESAYGNASPPIGTNYYESGTNLTCAITNSVVLADTQSWMMLVSTGWTGSGSVPASGATTNTGSFSITEDSTITWHWAIKDLILSNQTAIVSTNYGVLDSIIARDGYTVEGPGNVTFRAGDVIKLEPGFVARTGSVFHATIDP